MKLAKLETSQLVWITLKTTDQQRHPPCLTLTFQQSETPLEVFELFLWAHGILGFVHDCRSFRVRGFEKLASSKRPTQQPTYGHGSWNACAQRLWLCQKKAWDEWPYGKELCTRLSDNTNKHTYCYIYTYCYILILRHLDVHDTDKKREVGCSEVPRSTWRMQLNVWCTLMCLEQLAGFAH